MLVAVCLLLLLPVTAWGQPPQPGELRPELDGLNAERDRVESQVESLRQREGDARTRLAAVQSELEDAEDTLARHRADLEEAEAALATARAASEAAREELRAVLADLARSEDELFVATTQLEARVVAAYKYGQISFTEAFAGVSDMADFISSSTMVGHVLDGDRTMVADFRALHLAVEERRATAQRLRVEADQELAAAATAAAAVESATRAQADTLATIEQRHAEREELFLTLRDDRASAEGHLAGLEEESQRIADQLAAIARQQAEAAAAEAARRQREAEAAARADQPPAAAPSGPWLRPAPGPLTSPFGPRWGRNHNGVDIGGGEGTAIAASRSGTVVTVSNSCHPYSSWGCGGGFGNYVTIAHAGGMATISAHLATVSVGAGQQVEAGQVLGIIGNSGNSYGRHLHFELREAGVPRNPCGYITC